MFQLKRILFPVDFSDRCRGAAAYVEALVGRFDAELILLHVIETTYNAALEDLRESKLEHLDRLFGLELKHFRIRRLIDHGEPAQRIIRCASANHADLIMIPTQGMGIFRRLILGSTSAKVLHDADCPVWTGVHLENAPPLEAVGCKRIMCAVDLKPASLGVLDWATHLAEEYQAELTLVHVTPGSETPSAESTNARSTARHSLERLREQAGSRAAIRVEAGDVPKVIAHLSQVVGADVLVIGRKAAVGISGRLEMTAYTIIRQSPCPVVSV
jgi:nucleotide-binding universal stress UspA family protein